MDYKNTIGTILSTMVQIKLVVCTKRNKVWLIWYQGDVESGLRSWLGRDCEEASLALVVGEHGHLERLQRGRRDVGVGQQRGRAQQPGQRQLRRGRAGAQGRGQGGGQGRGQGQREGAGGCPGSLGHAVAAVPLRLEAAGLLVLGQVGLQGEAFTTFGAGKRFVRGVRLHVRSQVALIGEGFVAEVACEGFLPGVGPDVPLQQPGPGE